MVDPMEPNQGFNERALAADAARPRQPPRKTLAELEEDRTGELQAQARTELESWFEDKGLDINDPSHRVDIRTTMRRSSHMDKDRTFTLFTTGITFTVDDHLYLGEFRPRYQFDLGRALNVYIQIEPDYSKPGWWDLHELLPVPTLEHIGNYLREEQRRLVANRSIDPESLRQQGSELIQEHGILCPRCQNNTMTLCVGKTKRVETAGCTHCTTGIYLYLRK
jgi:hypothetical protein